MKSVSRKSSIAKVMVYIAAASALVFILKNAGNFLIINQLPRKADVIIVLSGGIGARTQRGIQLYRQGYAHYLIFTAAPSNLPKIEAESEGVPGQAILLDSRAQNTYQNAVYSKALMEQYGLHSAIVVSSDFHMRRVSLIQQEFSFFRLPIMEQNYNIIRRNLPSRVE